MKPTRVIVSILIALILIAGIWIFTQMNGNNPDDTTIEVVDTGVIDADEQITASETVNVAGFEVRLSPDASQITRLASSQTQSVNPTAIPTTIPTSNVVVATNTSSPVPTIVPTTITIVATNTPIVVAGNNNITFAQYTVQQGDTLYGIATRHGTSVSLMAEHGIAQDHLTPGAVLNIPIASSTACAAGQRTHIVLEGENVFRIAIRYGTTEEAIRAANPVINADYLIYVGDVICIP